MGRAAIHLPDETKPSDKESEKLLDLEDNPSLPDYNDVVAETRRSSWQRLKDCLPSVKDIVKLVLFSAVTVIGITFVSEFFFNDLGSTKPQFNRDPMYGTEVAEVEMCPSSGHTTSLSMNFTDPKKFTFTQLSEELPIYSQQSSSLVRTVGNIEVRNAVPASGPYIQVDLEISSSDARLASLAVGFEKDDSNLLVKTPRLMPGGMVSDTPCLNISAIISIPPATKLEHLAIGSETLAVVFHPGLDYAESRVVETKTQFESRSTYSRETIINVKSASVTGSYPLYDLLSIHTNSGSIDVNVDPKKASTEHVKPAVLRVTSNSGSVRAITSTVSVPDRDYQTTMSTSSGSINAAILHGLRTSLRSITGDITADLYPYGHNGSRTDIEVHDTSSSIDITLHSSLSHPTAPLKQLYAYYRGISGSLTLFYPAQWQGTVEGTTLSGSIDFNWQGLKIVKEEKKGWVKRTVEAIRGEGEGRLVFYETSGSVKLSGESGGL